MGDLKPVVLAEKDELKFGHVMPTDLATRLDQEAAKMGISRRALMNVIAYQYLESKEHRNV